MRPENRLLSILKGHQIEERLTLRRLADVITVVDRRRDIHQKALQLRNSLIEKFDSFRLGKRHGAFAAGRIRRVLSIDLFMQRMSGDLERLDPADYVAEWKEALGAQVLDVLPVSSATGAGLERLTEEILRFVPERVTAPVAAAGGPIEVDFEAEHLTYTPKGEGGYSVEAEEDGAFRIHGRGVEVLFERFDLENDEALGYLETRLTEMGVMAELKRAGFESGDEIRVGDSEFELH